MSQPAEGKSLEAHELFRDPQKHYVRVHGWVVVARSRLHTLMETNRNFGLRYMTLCGKDAIDIFLFKREQLIKDDGRGFPSVYYIENHYPSFAEVQPLLGRTKGKRISFEELVNQQWFEQLVRKQPFDVINLDFSGNCFPRNDPPFSTTLKALNRIIQLQSGNHFDLFVTFKALRSVENSAAVQELASNMIKNFSVHQEVEDAFKRQFRSMNPSQLSDVDYGLFLLATFPKIIFGFGANNGFNVSCPMKFVYKRSPPDKPPYQIVKFLFSMSAEAASQSFSEESRRHESLTAAYEASVIQDLNVAPIDVDQELVKQTSLAKQLKLDLQSVLELRVPFGK
jgi:hypothetical protein